MDVTASRLEIMARVLYLKAAAPIEVTLLRPVTVVSDRVRSNARRGIAPTAGGHAKETKPVDAKA